MAGAPDSETPDPEAPVAGTPDPDLTQGERAELARLRAEVADLRSREDGLRQQEAGLRRQESDLHVREAEVRDREAAVVSGARRHRVGWRTPVASVLIVLGCLLAPISVVGVWTANQVSDTNRYIANIEPLIHDPAVQGALTDKVTVAITSHLNIVGYTNQAASLLNSKGLSRVATLLKTFGPSIASAVAGFIHTQVSKIVTSPQFANTWIQVNTTAHAELVKALSGQGNGAVSVSNGQVVIDLAPFIVIVKKALVARGFSIVNSLPPIHPNLALFSSKDLVRAQTLYRLINDLKIVLPILTLLLLAAGVYIARGHRRALIAAGLGFAGSMLVLGLGLLIFRGIYLNTVPNNVLPSNAAAVIFDTFVRFIKEALRTLLVVGPGRRDRRVLQRPFGDRGPVPGGGQVGIRLDSRGGRAPGRVHRAGGPVDLPVPARAAHRRGVPGRAALRVLGPAHRRGGHLARRAPAGAPRADRADRPAAGPAQGGGAAMTRTSPGPVRAAPRPRPVRG